MMNSQLKYNVGIDLLKIVAMFMIVILHVLGFGNVVWNKTLSGLNYDIAWFLEIASFCAVNCYALASGYIGINTRVRYYKLVLLWLQIVFSGVVITLFFSIYEPQLVNITHWKNSLLPIFSAQYWYLTAYFGLFLFLPMINAGVQAIVSLQRKILFSTILGFLVVIPYLIRSDLFHFISGYSLIWLLVFYVLGAIMAKENLFQRFSKLSLFIIYLCMILVTFYLKKNQGIYRINYQSPTIVICSFSLLVLFSKVEVEFLFLIKLIKYIAGLTLGVYVFHEHPLIRAYYIKGTALDYFKLDAFYFTSAILGMAFIVFLSGALFDACRKWFFDRLDIKNKLEQLPYLG